MRKECLQVVGHWLELGLAVAFFAGIGLMCTRGALSISARERARYEKAVTEAREAHIEKLSADAATEAYLEELAGFTEVKEGCEWKDFRGMFAFVGGEEK